MSFFFKRDQRRKRRWTCGVCTMLMQGKNLIGCYNILQDDANYYVNIFKVIQDASDNDRCLDGTDLLDNCTKGVMGFFRINTRYAFVMFVMIV